MDLAGQPLLLLLGRRVDVRSECAQALLSERELVLELASLREVAGDHRVSNGLTRCPAEGRQDDVRPEGAAALREAPPLVLEAAVRRGCA